jgi:thiamine biosynthesis protein ThiS
VRLHLPEARPNNNPGRDSHRPLLQGDRLIAIHVNGQAREVPEGLTLGTLLDWLKLPTDRIAVEHNLEIVPRARWRETPVQGGDRLEVVHFVGGGFDSDDSAGARANSARQTAPKVPARAKCATRLDSLV